VSVQFGVVLPTRTRPAPLPLSEVLTIAAEVDANPGLGQLWVPDSILALPYYDSTVLLAAAAATTSRVKLGVACLASLGFRHPVIVAKEWANLDTLSGGRMILVACPGNATGAAVEKELGVFGLSYAEKLERFEEYVGFLRLASGADDAFDYHGKHVTVTDLTLRPAFVQHPLPIWMAANPSPTAGPKTVDRVLGRVARLAAGWMTYNVQPETLRARNARLTELRAAQGDHAADFPVAVFLNTNVHPDEQQAYADAAAKWAEQSTRNISGDDLRLIGAIGTPGRAAEFIAELIDAGATHIIFELLSINPRRQLELISEHLLPLLLPRRRSPATAPHVTGRPRSAALSNAARVRMASARHCLLCPDSCHCALLARMPAASATEAREPR
jgi:alkanesulfonate monooxygenase SsuD/methylene tetrahydromethanopterin reductase-like flavin-dependent oxidoreductase (luciferase family)